MNLHEYQAKELFKSQGVSVPRFEVISTSEQAVAAASSLGCLLYTSDAADE